jgi:WD40-like Beta Propeller Repeat
MTRRAATLALALAALLLPAGHASAVTPMVAAFDQYVSGKGFDIGLVNTATGRSLVVPGSVNTTADEFHPALTPDGRFLVFTRTTLVPQPDGDVVPPATRNVLMLDRQTGQIRPPFSGRSFEPGAGATIVTTAAQPILAYGFRVERTQPNSTQALLGGSLSSSLSFQPNQFAGYTAALLGVTTSSEPAGTFRDVPHAAVGLRGSRFIKATSIFSFSEGNGDIASVRTLLVDHPQSTTSATQRESLVLPPGPVPRHATPRVGDGHVALDQLTNPNADTGADIHTIQFPGDTAPTLLPAPVFSGRDERMPAWSPDGRQLAFVRATIPHSATTRRELLIFDSTTGVQDIVNPAIDLGTEAPTLKLRAFQHTWGGLSLGATSGADSVIVNCGTACTSGISGPATNTSLSPSLSGSGFSVGIIIARIVGTRRLLGRRIPRIRQVGRVPLGRATSRRPRFRWNARVNGRRLAAGSYLLTFRALNRRGRVLSTSRSIRFRLTAAGRVTGVRPA